MIGIIAVWGLLLIALHRLQAVHPRHEMIHEDGIGPVVLQIFDGLLGRLGHVDFDVVLLEHSAQDHASRLGIVDDQRTLLAHGTLV